MSRDQKNFLFLGLAPLIAVLVILMASAVKMDSVLTPMERKLLNFHHDAIPGIPERTMVTANSLKSPIALAKPSKKGFPEIPLKEILPPSPPAEKKVSMILVNEKRRIAVIDGQLVREGDILDRYRVSSILGNRVLLKGKEGEKWLKLE